MSSKDTTPQAVLRWKTNGEQIELFSMSSESEYGLYGAPDEDLTAGMKVIFEQKPEFIDISMTDLDQHVPVIHDRLYPALLEYIRSQLLYMNSDEISALKSTKSYNTWKQNVAEKKGGKIMSDGPHIMMVDREGSLI